MSYDIYVDQDRYVTYQASMDAAAIAGLVIGILCIISFLVGVILACCCRKGKPRPGFIISSNNTGGQTTQMEQPGIISSAAPGAIQPMQQYPPAYGQAQQKNLYPAVNSSN